MPPTSENFCGLCGIHLAGLKRRFQCPKDIQAFISRRCKPTTFLYARLTGDHPCTTAKRQGLCIPCVNWKRRVGSGAGLKRTKRPMLQFDQLVMYLLQPGRHQEPDHRCMERLVKAIRQGGNPFACVLPLPVRTIVTLIKGDTYLHCVMAWWEYNGRTEFFASAQEARRVRGAVKLLQAEDEEDEQ
jgi:hypothetical protein